MAKVIKDTFDYLGEEFQIRLLAQILVDRKFGESIIEIVDPNYFKSNELKKIASIIKTAYEEYNIIADAQSVEIRLRADISEETLLDLTLSYLKSIKEADLNDGLKIQERAMKFCRQKELNKTLKEIQAIVDKDDDERYDECEELLKKALSHGEDKDDGIDVFDNIEKVLEDDFRKPIPTGIRGLDDIMDGGLSKGELAIILAPFGVGKEQPNSARIYTPNGYKLMGDMQVGDLTIGINGKKQNVTGVFPQGEKDIYLVTFNDGTSTKCGLEHLWAVNSMNQRNRKTKIKGKNIKLPKDETFKILTTGEIIKKLKVSGDRFLNYRIPMISPVEFEKQIHPIDPYVLGVLLGDGNMGTSRITTKDMELVNILSSKCNITHRERCRDFDTGENLLVQRCIESVTILGIVDELKELGLRNTRSHEKFIPKQYLYTSIKDRVELLQGLLDTDGYSSKSGKIQFSTVSEQLSYDVRELVLSLGGFCSIKTKIPTYKYKGVKKNGKLSYTLTISFPMDLNIKPFKLKRKLERVVFRDKYSTNKFIKSIEFSHREEATCIMVDSNEHLYATDDFILTHNTTMMTKLASTAKDLGYNVLQIFFEDLPKVVQRKHLSCWTGIALNDLSLHRDEVLRISKAKKEAHGALKLVRFPSDGTTIPVIRKYVRKLIAQGFRPDLILLDYIDCIQPSKKVDDVNIGEGRVMREFESLLYEFDMAGWTAVQGNRSSLRAEVVESDQMAGSIKKGMIGHFIISIAKTSDQKEAGTATAAILKSRFATDGMILEHIIFDNSRVQIDMSKGGKSRSQYNSDKEIDNKNRVKELFDMKHAVTAPPQN